MIQMLLISGFLVLLLRDGLDGSSLGGFGATAAAGWTLGVLAGIWAGAHAVLVYSGRRLDRTGRLGVLRWVDTTLLVARLSATVVFWIGVLVLGWFDAVRSAMGDWVLLDEVVAIGPLVLVFVLLWWSQYPIDRRLREAVLMRELDRGAPIHAPPTRWGYVWMAMSHQALLVLVPIALIVAWGELVMLAVEQSWWPGGGGGGGGGGDWEWLVPVAQLGGALCVFGVTPPIMRLIWSTVPLGQGPLRDRLLGLCRAHGVRIRELLLWRTHGTMINGAVLGLFAPLRYILLTDALLDALSGPQVEAVMAHEIAHVRRRHMVWMAISMLASVMAVATASEWVLARLEPTPSDAPWVRALLGDSSGGVVGVGGGGGGWGETAATVVALGVGLLVFGFVSRRFEWQADAFAVKHLSGAFERGRDATVTGQAAWIMSDALGAVADLNHMPRTRWGWRHGSIASRQHRLVRLVGKRCDALPIDRQVRAIKIVSLLVLVAVVLVIAVGGG